MVNLTTQRTEVADVYFPEGLRWRDGSLWFSDVFGGTVSRLTGSHVSVVAAVPGMPSGLGWLPDGTLLVVSMQRRSVLAVGPDGTPSTYADLGPFCPQLANDMVVDRAGRAYVGNYGYDVDNGAPVEPTHLIRVDPDGRLSAEGPELVFPNGAVFVDGGKTLVVSETFADRVSAITVRSDGSLGERRTVLDLPAGSGPDGIDVDASGTFWVGCAYGGRAVAFTIDGTIRDEIPFPGIGVNCCAIGGLDGRTLFIALSPLDEAEAARHPDARIVSFRI